MNSSRDSQLVCVSDRLRYFSPQASGQAGEVWGRGQTATSPEHLLPLSQCAVNMLSFCKHAMLLKHRKHWWRKSKIPKHSKSIFFLWVCIQTMSNTFLQIRLTSIYYTYRAHTRNKIRKNKKVFTEPLCFHFALCQWYGFLQVVLWCNNLLWTERCPFGVHRLKPLNPNVTIQRQRLQGGN